MNYAIYHRCQLLLISLTGPTQIAFPLLHIDIKGVLLALSNKLGLAP